ncbi:MAG: hypothetical protein ACRELD_00570 [Longimicrobiales bacterium]
MTLLAPPAHPATVHNCDAEMPRNRIQTKHAAEAVLREIPSVVGACVHEDVNGHPREVHLLVRSGPNVRDLARDVRDLLEERLGIFVDQRIVSIAQLAVEEKRSEAAAAQSASAADEERPATGARGEPARSATSSNRARLFYDGLESRVHDSRVTVRVRLAWGGQTYTGEAVEVNAGHGRVRAAALAAARAATAAANEALRLEVEAASISRALERDYAVVSVLAIAPRLGRRPVPLVGAHAIETDVETAAALAVLKASNRLLEQTLQPMRSPGSTLGPLHSA